MVYGNRYGTLKSEVLSHLHSGHDVILNIDVQGAESIRSRASEDQELAKSLVSVFLTPATIAILENRLRKRATDSEDAIARRFELFSSVASTSAGGELKNCEVLLFGNSPKATGAFRIGHGVLADAIDAEGVRSALRSAGLAFEGTPGEAQAKRIVSVFAKAEASPSGAIRGRRNTMLSDADINYERHARAAVGAVIASITGDPAIFVSGGTEHQCAPGAAPIAAIVRV